MKRCFSNDCESVCLSHSYSFWPHSHPDSATTLPDLFFVLIPSDVQSLTQQSDLEAVVKTLAPALLAELVQMKPSSSASRAKKDSTSETSQKKSKVLVLLHMFFFSIKNTAAYDVKLGPFVFLPVRLV